MKKPPYNWLPDFVYGGIDGSITAFAVVAGVVGAGLSTPVILILGFANLFADGFSMAVGKYSSDKAELERIARIKKEEAKSILDDPEEEKEEVEEILKRMGFRGQDLARAQKVITSDPEVWIKVMLNHEFNVIEENFRPATGALATFLAFLSIGLIPLVGYSFQAIMKWEDQGLFLGTSVATLMALFIVGTVKSRFSNKNWALAGFETALIGGMAASLAYLVGDVLGKLLSVG